MGGIVTPKFNVFCALSQLGGVVRNARGRIEFIALAGKMKNRGVSLLVRRAFPISRQTARDTNHAAQDLQMRESEAVVQRAALREAEQKNAFGIRNAFVDERVHHIEHGLMMNCDCLLGMEVREPAKSVTQRATFLLRFSQMLMGPLQRSDRETFRRDHLRFTHRVPLARPISVQGDE